MNISITFFDRCFFSADSPSVFATSAQANNNPIFEEQEYKPIHASENASDYDTAAELPGGNIDYGIYEEYGLIYDKNSKCYTYKGNVVRFFNDPDRKSTRLNSSHP